MEKTKSQLFANFLLYYFAWWSIPFFAVKNMHSVAFSIFIICIITQFMMVSDNRKEDLIETGIIFLTLSALDLALIKMDYIVNLTDSTIYWPFLLNIIFATTFSYAFSVIRNSRILQLLIAAVLAPITYIRASDLGLIELYEPFINYYIIHVISWMIIIPLNFHIVKLLKGIYHDKKSFRNFQSRPMGRSRRV